MPPAAAGTAAAGGSCCCCCCPGCCSAPSWPAEARAAALPRCACRCLDERAASSRGASRLVTAGVAARRQWDQHQIPCPSQNKGNAKALPDPQCALQPPRCAFPPPRCAVQPPYCAFPPPQRCDNKETARGLQDPPSTCLPPQGTAFLTVPYAGSLSPPSSNPPGLQNLGTSTATQAFRKTTSLSSGLSSKVARKAPSLAPC